MYLAQRKDDDFIRTVSSLLREGEKNSVWLYLPNFKVTTVSKRIN